MQRAVSYFREEYSVLRARYAAVHEEARAIPEYLLQCAWHDQLFPEERLSTQEGHTLRILSPGWWNRQEGPDFRGAQIEFNGVLHSGDVEVHLDPGAWKSHGHHLDPRYNDVILHVVLAPKAGVSDAVTHEGRAVPTLALADLLPEDLSALAEAEFDANARHPGLAAAGRCSELAARRGSETLKAFLDLAGEWRMLNKARALRDRMDQVGEDQAIYEAFLYACGYSQFKHHFRAVARQLPYERARQLAMQAPFLLETALLQIAGLLPQSMPETTENPHFARLNALRREQLEGLRSLPLLWRRNGVRPINFPERRLAGAAMFLTRTAHPGLAEMLRSIWREGIPARERRRQFEALFPKPLGFWAAHCTWTGQAMHRPSSPLGSGRIRSIIGNIFIPAGLAFARQARNRLQEELVYELFAALPREPKNQVVSVMTPRILGEGTVRLRFRAQQGLLQMHQDWCAANPSCRNCPILRHLETFAAHTVAD